MNSEKKVLLIGFESPSQFSCLEKLPSFYTTQLARDESMAKFLIREWEPSIIIALEHLNMISILSDLKSSPPPFLVVGKGNIGNEEKAFHSGASYYVHSNASPLQLQWRIEALFKTKVFQSLPSNAMGIGTQSGKENSSSLNYSAIEIFPKDFLVKRAGHIISTTPTQFKLLLAFIENQEQLLTRAWIKEQVWENSDISPRSIDAQISKLKKIVPEIDQYLMNIYGKGYILATPNEEAA